MKNTGRKSEWARTPRASGMPLKVVEAIGRRRRQMLVHSYLYYRMDEPTIDDHVWSKWAQQLARLQDRYGHRVGFYDAAFKDWDGSSGFHLPYDADIANAAMKVLTEVQAIREMLS